MSHFDDFDDSDYSKVVIWSKVADSDDSDDSDNSDDSDDSDNSDDSLSILLKFDYFYFII